MDEWKPTTGKLSDLGGRGCGRGLGLAQHVSALDGTRGLYTVHAALEFHSPFLMGFFGICLSMNFAERLTHLTICSSKEIHRPTRAAPLHAEFNMDSSSLQVNNETKARHETGSDHGRDRGWGLGVRSVGDSSIRHIECLPHGVPCLTPYTERKFYRGVVVFVQYYSRLGGKTVFSWQRVRHSPTTCMRLVQC